MMDKRDQNLIDAYIEAQDVEVQDTLHRLRAIVKSELPPAEEVISYQVPCFKYHYLLVGFGATRCGCSFHIMSPTLVDRMRADLEAHRLSGTTIHFLPGEPVPEALIRQIVRARITQNEERAAARRSGRR